MSHKGIAGLCWEVVYIGKDRMRFILLDHLLIFHIACGLLMTAG